MSTFKKTKVVMLSTNEKANEDKLIYREGRLMFQTKKEAKHDRKWSSSKHYHLYFLSNEEIKEGDWVLTPNNEIKKFGQVGTYLSKDKKIIATTDKSLTINSIYGVDRFDASIFSGSGKSEMIKLPQMFNLPQPSQLFIEKFVEEYNKGSVITEVMVEYEPIGAYSNPKYDSDYRLKVNSKDNTITIRKIKNSWSREEVEKLCREARYTTGVVEIDKWIEKNL